MERAVEVVTGSESAHDLCKKLVHADFSEGKVKGAFIYSIDPRSTLVELAGYGKPFAEPASEFNLWDEHPVSDCVRGKKIICEPQDAQTLICLPFSTNGVPNGALVVVCSPEVKATSIGEEAMPVLSKLGGFFLQASTQTAQRTPTLSSQSVSLDEITTRQIQILGLMGDGLTNAEIAGRVLLSESTVRQETIRIYRALAVGGRLEAVAKARALGLISKVTPPPNLMS